jgi:hypothetical protein
MESVTNAGESDAQKTKRMLGTMNGRSGWGYCLSCTDVRVHFSSEGDFLLIAFADRSALKIERQAGSAHGLSARVVQEPEAGRIPAPWEDV